MSYWEWVKLASQGMAIDHADQRIVGAGAGAVVNCLPHNKKQIDDRYEREGDRRERCQVQVINWVIAQSHGQPANVQL